LCLWKVERLIDSGMKKILGITLAVKLFSLALILLAYRLLPFNVESYWVNYHFPIDAVPNWVSAFKTWDAQYYLYLANWGYSPGSQPDAFYPLLPFLISQVQFLFFGNTLVTGLVLSIIFTLTGVGFLYQLVRESWGETVAFRSCVALLAFPTAFYLGLVYSESLFLALAVAFFYYWRHDRLAPAFFCAFLLPLARPTGVLVLIPALVMLWVERHRSDPIHRKKYWVPLGFILGNLFFLAIMKYTTGDIWTYAKVQGYFLNGYSALNLIHPFHWFLANFIHNAWTFNGFETSGVNRICFVLVVAALAFSFKTLEAGLWTYALVVGLSLGVIGDLLSYPRYALVVFPLFIWASLRWGNRLFYYWIPGFFIQALLLIAHALNNWVA
jgi:hypothetical protein